MFQVHQISPEMDGARWYKHVQTPSPNGGPCGTSQVSFAIFRPQRSRSKSRSEPRPLFGIDKTWCKTGFIPRDSLKPVLKNREKKTNTQNIGEDENGWKWIYTQKIVCFLFVNIIRDMMIHHRMELDSIHFQSNPHAKCETKTWQKKSSPMNLPASKDLCHTFSTRARNQPWHLPARVSIWWMMLDDWLRLIWWQTQTILESVRCTA